MTDEPTSLIIEHLKAIRSEVEALKQEVRADLAQIYQATNANTAQMQRILRRMNELPLDLETMMKAELMGRLGHMERQMESHIDSRLDAIEECLKGH